MQKRELSFNFTRQLKAELEAECQRSGRGLKTQVRFYLQVLLRVAQTEHGLKFAYIEAEMQDHSGRIVETHKADLSEEEASYLKELAKECGWSVSKLVRVLLRTAHGLHNRVAPNRGLIGKEELIVLVLWDLQLRSRGIQ